MTTVTNRKTTWQSDTNPDIDARAITTAGVTSGTIAQVVALSTNNSGSETLINTANPLPVALSGGTTFAAPSNSTSSAQEASRVVKASAGTLFTISGFNNHTADQFIQVFDASSLPANGTVPAIVIQAYAGATFGYTGGIRGRAFSTGIVVCNSTTGATKALGSANCLFDVQFT